MTDVLIVDDSQDNAKLIEAALSVMGYDVVITFTAEMGLTRAGQLLPNLIIVDLRLYGSNFDGWELIRYIRSDDMLCNVPIIVTSVEVMPDDRQRAIDAGCNCFFSKPFRIGELREQIAYFIGLP